MKEPVIIEAVRTGLGRRDGALSGIRTDEFYAQVLNAILDRTRIAPDQIEDVVTGSVTQMGEQGANLSRLSVLLSKLPHTVAGTTLNRLCGSSQQAIHFAAQAIAAGDMAFVIAGGAENMSRVPMFSDIAGGFEKLNPRLHEKYEIIHQGESAERIAERYGLKRGELDRFSAQSHQKAKVAIEQGWFSQQLVPLNTPKGTFERDEGVRFQIDIEKMAKLPPVFRKDGVITAANSSQISDGAAAILIGERSAAEALGLKPRAKFRARVVVAGDPTLQLMEVIPATRLALERARLKLSDIDIIEINEAFASVVLGWAKELSPPMERVNPNGGAIAHGHPLGATGAVLMTKLLYELERIQGKFGLQVMCIGHGMATATIIERV